MHRVILQVGDIERAKAFYAKLLGDPPRAVGGTRHYFDCGGVIFAILDQREAGHEARPTPDFVYFAVDDIEAVHARAGELGCVSAGDVRGASAGDVVVRP